MQVVEQTRFNEFIPKDQLINKITTNLFATVENAIQSGKVNSDGKIYIVYELYSKLDISPKKINELLNLYVQSVQPDLYIKSEWKVLETAPVSPEIAITIDKIQVSIIVSQNDKNIAIKRFANGCLYNLVSNNRKMNDYYITKK